MSSNIAEAAVLESQPDASVIASSACNATGHNACHMYVGGKYHRESFVSTSTRWFDVTASSTLYLSIYIGVDQNWDEYVSGIDVSVTNLDRNCSFRGYYYEENSSPEFFNTIVTSSNEDPVLLKVPLIADTSHTSGCSGWQPGDDVSWQFGGGNWNGLIGTRGDGNGSQGANAFFILSDSPEIVEITNDITASTTWSSTQSCTSLDMLWV